MPRSIALLILFLSLTTAFSTSTPSQAQETESAAHAKIQTLADALKDKATKDDALRNDADALIAAMQEAGFPEGLVYGAHKLLGDCYMRLREPGPACDHFAAAVALNANDLTLRTRLVDAALNAGRPNIAQDALQPILDNDSLKDWHPWAARRMQAAQWIGKSAPDFVLTDTNDKQVKLSDLRGTTVLLDFGATWAAPWRRALPDLRAMAETAAKRDDFAVITVSYDKNEETLAAAVSEYKLTWTCCWDEKGGKNEVASAYEITSIPTWLLIDGKGVVRYREFPADSPPGPVLEQLLQLQPK